MKIKFIFKREVFLFIVIGITAVLIDISTYLLIFYLTQITTFSKFTSFLFGACFSYYGNKTFTFNAKTRRLTPYYFSATYLISLALNIFINNFSISLFNTKNSFTIYVSLFLATLFSAIFNFMMMKFLVFRKLK